MGEQLAGEADKIEQLWRNVLTCTMTHKEQLNTSTFNGEYFDRERKKRI